MPEASDQLVPRLSAQDKQSQRQAYLDYIRRIHDQRLQAANRSGFTLWGALVAGVYVIWHTIPLYVSVSPSPDAMAYALDIYAFSTWTLVFLIFALSSENMHRKPGEYTLRPRKRHPSAAASLLVIFILFALPLWAAHNSQYEPPLLAEIQKRINLTLVTTLIALTTLSALVQSFRQRNDYGTVSGLIANTKQANAIYRHFFFYLSLSLAIGNGLALSALLKVQPQYLADASIILGVDLSVISFCAVVSITLLSSRQADETFSRLERDAVLNDLTATEIRHRLQEELIGEAVGDWFGTKTMEVRSLAQAWRSRAEHIPKFLEEFEQVDKDYTHERAGRLIEEWNAPKPLAEEYQHESKRLINTLKQIVKARVLTPEDTMTAIIKEVLNEIAELHEELDRQVWPLMRQLGVQAEQAKTGLRR